MSWLFTIALLVHLLAALLMVAAMAWQAAIAFLIRQAATPSEVRRILVGARWIPRLFGPATGLILVTGIYMGVELILAGEYWGWLAVALITVVALAMIGKSSGKRRNMKLGRLVAESTEEQLSSALQDALREPSSFVHVALGVWTIGGVVVLMVYEPGIWISIVVMVVALLATAVTRSLLMAHSVEKQISMDDVDSSAA